MSVDDTGLTLTIDGESTAGLVAYSYDPEYETVSTMLPVKEPDPDWVHVDPAGHLHAWAEPFSAHVGRAGRPETPTLRTVVTRIYFCGDCADEHTDTEQRCVLCSAPVVPGMRYARDGNVRSFLSSQEWRFEVTLAPSPGWAPPGWRDPAAGGRVTYPPPEPVDDRQHSLVVRDDTGALVLFGMGRVRSGFEVRSGEPVVVTLVSRDMRRPLSAARREPARAS